MSTTLDRFGRIDILVGVQFEYKHHDDLQVNNAGINPFFGDLAEVSDAIWNKTFDVNCKATFLLTQLVAPHMMKSGSEKKGIIPKAAICDFRGGSIVMNASTSAYSIPAKLALYGITKTVLLAMTKAFAHELAPHKIRVNCVAPGVIKTRFSQMLWDPATADARAQHSEAQNDMQRTGAPLEVAAAVAYLVSGECDR